MGFSQQVLTLFACFMFIGFWHGATVAIFIWVLVNFLTILSEKALQDLTRSNAWANVRVGTRRFHQAPYVIVNIVSIVILAKLERQQRGYIMVEGRSTFRV